MTRKEFFNRLTDLCDGLLSDYEASLDLLERLRDCRHEEGDPSPSDYAKEMVEGLQGDERKINALRSEVYCNRKTLEELASLQCVDVALKNHSDFNFSLIQDQIKSLATEEIED